MPEIDIRNYFRHGNVRQGMVQVAGLPIEDVTVSVFASFLKDHILEVVGGAGSVVGAEFDHVDGVFFVV